MVQGPEHEDFRVTAFLMILILIVMIALIIAAVYSERASLWCVLSPTINFNGDDVSSQLNSARNYYNWSSNVNLIGLAVVIVLLIILPLFIHEKWHHISIILIIVLIILMLVAIAGAVLALLGYFKVRDTNNGSTNEAKYSGIFSAVVGFIVVVIILLVLIMIVLGKAFSRIFYESGDTIASSLTGTPQPAIEPSYYSIPDTSQVTMNNPGEAYETYRSEPIDVPPRAQGSLGFDDMQNGYDETVQDINRWMKNSFSSDQDLEGYEYEQ